MIACARFDTSNFSCVDRGHQERVDSRSTYVVAVDTLTDSATATATAGTTTPCELWPSDRCRSLARQLRNAAAAIWLRPSPRGRGPGARYRLQTAAGASRGR
jgi:hypothetical protein